jgi:hypothetical protein
MANPGELNMRNFIDRQQELALERIENMRTDEILSKPVDDWVSDLVQQYGAHEILQIDRTAITRTQHDGEVPADPVPNPSFARHVRKVRGLIHPIHIPFTGNRNFFFYQPPGNIGEFPGGEVRADEIVLAIGGASLTTQDIHDNVEKQVALIEKGLESFRGDAERFRENLPGALRPALQRRRLTAQAEVQAAGGLKYPIKPNPNAPPPPTVPPIRKRIVPAPLRPASSPDLTLQEEHYQNILNICENMARVMERSPSAFEKILEEDLRWHFIMQLNAQYDGVSGEAFNYQGKTDILVRMSNHNIFVAECKYWSGAKGLRDTLDQLFKYVTWRDTKTSIIKFVGRKNFTATVEEATKMMAAHPLLEGQPRKEGDTRFRYILKHPDDAQRLITMTMLLFHVPKSTSSP